MKRNEHGNSECRRRRRIRTESLVLALSLILVIGSVMGGTLAWLLDSTEKVTNTFSPSDISIELTESKKLDLKMIPGWTITKDPVVTVKAGSEDCWVFIKVEKSGNLDDYITWDIDPNNWELLAGTEDVYYCKVTDVTADRSIKVLGYYTDPANPVNEEFHPNEVLVKDTVTKEMMDAIDGIDSEGKTDSDAAEAEIAARPTLTFTAYAVQLWKNNTEEFTAAEAWEQVSAGITGKGN